MVGVIPEHEKFFVFVDDGSTDNSISTIEQHFGKNNAVILENKKNFRPGYSFNKGFDWITNNSKDDNDRIVTLEGDNTSSTDILPNMLTISGLSYDLVLASVYAQGGGLGKTNIFRVIISLFANLIIRLHIPDQS